MFEDDDIEIDFDEIMNCSPPSLSLKRQSSDPVSAEVESSKKPKKSTSESSVGGTEQIIASSSCSSISTENKAECLTASNEPKKKFSFKKNPVTPPTVAKHDIISEVPKEEKAVNSPSTSTSTSTNDIFIQQPRIEINTDLISKHIPKTCERNFDRSPSSDNSLRKNQSFEQRSITKRKFPGPAGLLPERGNNGFGMEESTKSDNVDIKDGICSQNTYVPFNDGPWEKMMEDFLSNSSEKVHLPDKYNIQWIRSRVLLKKLINQKAPFLAAFVLKISSHSIQNPIVNLTLKDKTGTLQGTIVHHLYEEYSNDLTVGSVVVLKEIGVLNTGTANEPYLTITPNNLISIYTNQNREQIENSFSPKSNKEIRKICIQNLSSDEIWGSINDLKRIHKAELENSHRNARKSSFSCRDFGEPMNVCDDFKKAVHNFNQQKDHSRPNLNNLRIKSLESNNLNNIKTNNTIKNPNVPMKSNNSVQDEKINEILDLFNTREGIDEFFNDEPNFCSTQISPKNPETSKGIPSSNNDTIEPTKYDKTVSSNSSMPVSCTKEKNMIWDDIFEGVDASSLFDDF